MWIKIQGFHYCTMAQYIEKMWRNKKHIHNLDHENLNTQHLLEEEGEKQWI